MVITNKFKSVNVIILCVALILTIVQVSAEEFNLLTTESITYRGITIKLTSIGNQGSAAIQVGAFKTIISKDQPERVGDLTITLLEILPEVARVKIETNVACLQSEDCNDGNPCTENICTNLKECAFKTIIAGCASNNECKPVGSVTKNAEQEVFCSADYRWLERKQKNSQCKNSYECLSNLCKNNLCANQNFFKFQKRENESMTIILIVIVVGVLALIKGILLITKPREIKKLMRESSYMRDTTLKIIGITIVLIGLALIIFALT